MRGVCILLIFGLYIIQSAWVVRLSEAGNDLARHVRDGELILAGSAAPILHTNYHSYAVPDAPFLNHHWLTTVFLSLGYNLLGFQWLNVSYIALGAGVLALYLRVAIQEAGWTLGTSLAIFLLPIMAARPGIRTEMATSVLLAVFFTILWNCYRGKLEHRWLWVLPLLEILWVNLHPGFVLGPVLIGAFLAPEAIRRWIGYPPGNLRLVPLTVVLICTVAAGIVNPNGIDGLLFPITVSVNYGIEVGENMSMLVLHLQHGFMRLLFWVEIGIAVTVVIVWTSRKRMKSEWPLLFFTVPAAIMTLLFARVYAILCFFMFVTSAVYLGWLRNKGGRPMTWVATGLTLTGIAGAIWNVAERGSEFGVGPVAEESKLARFLDDNHIDGRVFNNYNLGGYLIFHRRQKVFIDSRPEAYPSLFLMDEYQRPIVDEDLWRRLHLRYRFDYICFGLSNRMEAEFFARRVLDREWALVYLTRQGRVLVRRDGRFKDLIAKHEIRLTDGPFNRSLPDDAYFGFE